MKIDKLIYTILRYLYETSDLSSPSMDPISAEALHVPIEQLADYNRISIYEILTRLRLKRIYL